MNTSLPEPRLNSLQPFTNGEYPDWSSAWLEAWGVVRTKSAECC
jgi:hypothetical protein